MQILFDLSPEQGYVWLGGSDSAHTLASFFKTGVIPDSSLKNNAMLSPI